MNINEIKELMAQFDQSSLREFSYKNREDEVFFSKNELSPSSFTSLVSQEEKEESLERSKESLVEEVETLEQVEESLEAVGEVIESPLVGVAYLAPAPDKPVFVQVGDTVQKGQTLLIIEAMKVMNEVLAPKDGVITEVLVENEEMVEFGKGLVRIK